jgi:hypothetical protein
MPKFSAFQELALVDRLSQPRFFAAISRLSGFGKI